MLTQTAMFVVFMLDEIISQGSEQSLTAGLFSYVYGYGKEPVKVPQ